MMDPCRIPALNLNFLKQEQDDSEVILDGKLSNSCSTYRSSAVSSRHHQDISDEIPAKEGKAQSSARYQVLFKKFATLMRLRNDDVKSESQNSVVCSHHDGITSSVKPGRASSATYNSVVQKKLDAEEILNCRRKEAVLETVLVDQLSRITTNSGETENLLLAARVRFSARIHACHDVDSVKDLTGFYFNVDQSLTIYEYKQFGKSAKALPFIVRGIYGFVRGTKAGRKYKLVDIFAGSDLEFSTANQRTLPQRLRDDAVLRIRVTDVDDRCKQEILLPGVRPSLLVDEYIKLHIPQESTDFENQYTVQRIQNYSRAALKGRGIKTVVGLWDDCRRMDRHDAGRLPRFELEKLLVQYRVEPEPGLLDDLWIQLDYDGSGSVDYGEFLTSILGEMTEWRKLLVRKAFHKMDHRHGGVISSSDMMKFFSLTRSRKESPGQLNGMLESFLESLGVDANGEIPYRKFEAYYEGLSIELDSDELFCTTLRETWGI